LSIGYSIFIIQKKFYDHFEHDLIGKGLKIIATSALAWCTLALISSSFGAGLVLGQTEIGQQ
jgi:hypothetical protein